GRRLDERLFKIAETHDKFGVPYTRKDNSEIKRKAIAMTRKGIRKNKKESLNKETIASTGNISKVKRNRINEKENNLSEESNHNILQLEIEERKMQLTERQTANRKALVEIEKLELENLRLRKEINN
ncbi:12965_t:CDS:2, partial [Funneliformis mosseae]